MKTVKIDGKSYEIVRQETAHESAIWVSLFVRLQGESGGPTSQHYVPGTSGKFRTNGHDYDFTEA